MTFRNPLFALAAGAMLAASPAAAQLTLPGAAPPAPPSAAAPGDPTRPKPKPKAKKKDDAAGPVKAPPETAATDRSLLHNGTGSRLELEMRDKALTVVKLSFSGETPGKPGEACKVDAVAATPLPATPAGKPHGLARYEVDAPSCKFAFEILDGAVLVESAQRPCEFSAPACRVDVNGVWGPLATSLPARAKEIESARTRAETTMRAHFKALVAKTSGNDAVKLVAREQAGFTSQREMICRDYRDETKHGFCAARITEARAVTLAARVAEPAPAAEADKGKKPRPKKARAKATRSASPTASGPLY